MNIKAIFKKESLVTWKNMKLILIIALFNFSMLIYYILQLNFEFGNIIKSMQINYKFLLNLFKKILTIDYIIILFLVPAISSASISMQRQTKNFDLLLSTIISIPEIVLGELLTHFVNLFIFLISTLPIFMLLYIYGGLTFVDFIILLLNYLSSIYLLVCIGIFSSSISKKTNIATILAYIISIFIFFVSIIIFANAEKILALNTFRVLLLFNPLVTFCMALNRLSNTSIFFIDFFDILNNYTCIENCDFSIFLGIIFQILLGSLFILIALKKIKSIYKR